MLQPMARMADNPRRRAAGMKGSAIKAAMAGTADGSEYYWSLVDTADPHDPLRKLALVCHGRDDGVRRCGAAADDAGRCASASAMLRRYGNTATLSLSGRPADGERGFGRGMHGGRELSAAVEAELDLIASDPDIGTVLVYGGDCLGLPAPALDRLLERLAAMEHVRSVFLESQLPVYHPARVFMDDVLLETLARHAAVTERTVYLATQFHHPREVTPEARLAFETLQQAGVTVINYSPILRGINDEAAVLGELLDKLSQAGVIPQSFYMPHPESGARDYALPLEQSYRLTEEAKALTTGLGKKVRLTLSDHVAGKLEVLAIEHGKAYLKAVHAADGHTDGGIVIRDCGEAAFRPILAFEPEIVPEFEPEPPHLYPIASEPEQPEQREKSATLKADAPGPEISLEDWFDLERTHFVPNRVIGD